MASHIRALICFLLISILSSCTDTCIDPDDFGFETVVVPAKYKKEEISGANSNQVVSWIDTNLYSNGRPISVFVKNWKYIKNSPSSSYNNYSECSAWSPWYGEESETKENLLSKTTYRLPECKFEDNKMCQSYEGIYAKIKNAPCLMKKGIGLYGLISKENPNRTNLTKENPTGMSFHIGQCSLSDCPYKDGNGEIIRYKTKSIAKDGSMEEVGGIIYDPKTQKEDDENYSGEEQINFNTGIINDKNFNKYKIYLKIVDTYYEDNSGQYIAVFKSGFSDYKTNFFESTSNDVKKMIFGEKKSDGSESLGIVGQMYTKTAKNEKFRFFVRFIMIVYVIIYGMMISIGAARLNQFEILSRLTKLILISLLISDSGIDFFSKYLLSFFWDGAYFFKKLALGVSSESYGSGDILNTVFSTQVLTKLAAIMLSSIFGILYIIIFFGAMLIFCYIIFQTYVRFITATILLGLIIALSPVYFSFMLLGFTKKFFDIWVNQAIYYTIFPLFLFIGISITSSIIKEQIYIGLGFPVCRVSILPFPNFASSFSPKNEQYSADTSILSWPVPKIAKIKMNIVKNPDGEEIIEDSTIPHIPVPYTDKTKPNSSELYAPYELIEQRYPDLPYLDIKNPEHVKKIKNFRDGDLIDFGGLAVICICIYILSLYNQEAEGIARGIGSVDLNSTSVKGMSKVASNAMSHTLDKYVSKAAFKVASPVLKGGALLLKSSGSLAERAGAGLSNKGFKYTGKFVRGLGVVTGSAGKVLNFAGGIIKGIKGVGGVAEKFRKKYLTGDGVGQLIKRGWNNSLDKLDNKIFGDNANAIEGQMKDKNWRPGKNELEKIKEYDIKDAKGKSIDVNSLNFKAQEIYEKKIDEILKKVGTSDISYKKINELTMTNKDPYGKIAVTENQKRRVLVKHFAKKSPDELKEFIIKNKYGIKDNNVKVPDWIRNEIDASFDTRNQKREIKVNKIFNELNLNSDIYDREKLYKLVASKEVKTDKQMEILKLVVSKDDYKIIEQYNDYLISGKSGDSSNMYKKMLKDINIKLQGEFSGNEFKEYLQKSKEYDQSIYDDLKNKDINDKNVKKQLSILQKRIDLADVYSYDKDKLKEFLNEQNTGRTKEEISKLVDENLDYKDNTRHISTKYNINEDALKDIAYDHEKYAEYVKNNLEKQIEENLRREEDSPYKYLINANEEKERIEQEKNNLKPKIKSTIERLSELKKEKAELERNKSSQEDISKIEGSIEEQNGKVKIMEQEFKKIEEKARNTDKELAKRQKNVDDYRIKAQKEFNDSINDYILNQDSLESIYTQKQNLDAFKDQYLSLKVEGLIKS